MKYYRLKFADGTQAIAKAKSDLALIKKHHLYTKEHINTTIIQLEGEQLAIARANDIYNNSL